MNNGPEYEKGQYRGTIISQALGESNTGTPQFVFRFTVDARVNAGQEYATQEGERTCYIYLNDKTMEFATRDIRSLGFDKNSLRYLDPTVAGFHDFVGTSVQMFCKHEEYQGKTREKWNISNPREFDVKPVEQSKLRNLDNLFGRAMKASGATVKAPIAPPQTDAGLGVTDDDVPF